MKEISKRVSFMFSEDLIARVAAAKVKTGMSLSEFIRRAVVKALELEGL